VTLPFLLRPCPLRRGLAALLLVYLLHPLAAGQSLHAQEPVLERVGGGWNAPLALDLVARARATRAGTLGDSSLRSYQSRAEGYVYFYADRPEVEERTLIRTDQLALEVLWKAPGQSRQRIVGRRDEKALPTTINYHLDHLSVVQDEFEDVIRIGDGDEVSDVAHPVAPGAEEVYDYRVADSLTLAFGGQEQVRVYEVQVRPKRPDLPGFVGTIFLDRERASIVRMAFSFTPSSYVDPYLDYIRISLDNALWMEEFWLPYQQEAEIRRELPQLDFLAGSVIRARFRVRDYQFNVPLPDLLFAGRTLVVNAGPREVLEAFDFERGLYDDLEEAGLAPSGSLADIEQQVRDIGMRRALSGLAPVRLHLGGASDLLRHNRAEGWAVGAGTTIRLPSTLDDGARLRLVGGWAFGAERAWGRAEVTLAPGAGDEVQLAGRFDELVDIGPIPGASRLVNSLAGLRDEDYLDPWVERSMAATWSHALGGGPLAEHPATLVASASVARQRSAELATGVDDFRPLRPIDDGTFGRVAVGLETGSPTQGLRIRTSLGVGFGEGRRWVEPRLHAGWRSQPIPGTWTHSLDLDAGWVSRQAPAQARYLLGGRETLPGHPYRTAGGDAFLLLRARSSRPIWTPWVTGHLLASAGWTGDLGEPAALDGWALDGGAENLRGSLGVGVGLFWDALRFDLARGVPDGDWAVVFSVRPDFRSWL